MRRVGCAVSVSYKSSRELWVQCLLLVSLFPWRRLHIGGAFVRRHTIPIVELFWPTIDTVKGTGVPMRGIATATQEQAQDERHSPQGFLHRVIPFCVQGHPCRSDTTPAAACPRSGHTPSCSPPAPPPPTKALWCPPLQGPGRSPGR